ncbi:glycosyltransferase family 4 protein [Lentibacillus sediminis]|uniref:glycosyltransferase family 4 protein n=1 Tax=Lentibacillus sediminis TaxID=1940529 RepID=UPI000C1C5B1F|nr:glycosyltransferase family 4 protein [Lentibacillus sediminis]
MNVAISAIRTKDTRINRYELVTSIQKMGHKVIYLGQESDGELHADYNKLDVKFLPIPLGRTNTNPIREIFSVSKTRRILKQNDIGTIIVYGIRTFPAMVLAAKLAGVKRVICIVNGSGRLFQLPGIKGFLVKAISYPMLGLAFLLSTRILFQNQDDMEMIGKKKLLWKNNYGITNGSGVNLEEFRQKRLEESPVFMMISRLTGSKGVNEYLEAIEMVKEKHPESIFYLIGPMDDDSTMDQILLQRLVDEGTLKLIGKVDDVRLYLQKSRIFVLPSYYPEGVPRSILEALAMGRPVITTTTPGCKETVIDGVNGFLVPPRDSKKLAERMIWMVENKDKVDNMGQQSRILCEEKFDVNHINQIILRNIESNDQQAM